MENIPQQRQLETSPLTPGEGESWRHSMTRSLVINFFAFVHSGRWQLKYGMQEKGPIILAISQQKVENTIHWNSMDPSHSNSQNVYQENSMKVHVT